jgi:hypothetical protein
MIRGAMIEQLEGILACPHSRLRLILEATGAAMELAAARDPGAARPHAEALARLAARLGRSGALDFLYELQVALFPEEFDGPTRPAGLVPKTGPRRAGQDRLAVLVAKLTAKMPGARPA